MIDSDEVAICGEPNKKVDLYRAEERRHSPLSLMAVLDTSRFGLAAKRCFDVVVATGLLILGAPLVILMAAAILFESPGNPFFVQTRIGRHGQVFRLIKMRTLYRDRFGIDLDSELELDSPRITRVGRWLRRSKLDEWPQLFNVMMGQMSLIGPRPDIPEQVARYTDQECERLCMRPGLTGAVQVSGNTALSWPQRFAVDRWYVQHWSWGVDLRVLRLTCAAVLAGEDLVTNRLNLPPRYFATAAASSRGGEESRR